MSCGVITRGEVLASSYNGSDICRNAGGSLFQEGAIAVALEQSAHFSDELTEGGAVLGRRETR